MKTLTIEEQLYLFRKIKRCLILKTPIQQHVLERWYNDLGTLERDSWNKNLVVNINGKPCSIMTISTHIENDDDIIRYKCNITQDFTIWFDEINKFYKLKILL